MKVIIASDIHGSNFYTKKFIKVIQNEKPDKIILLGDIYYHGPRNKQPKGYAPMKVAENLNQFTEILSCVKGNCDAEVDQMISSFKFEDSISLNLLNKTFLFTHGHKLDFEKLPEEYDFIFGGHTHIHTIQTFGNTTYINPGSLSIPKENTNHSYAIINNNTIEIKNLKNKLIKSIKF